MCGRVPDLQLGGSRFKSRSVYFAPRSTQPSIHPGSVSEYQPLLGRQRQVRLIPTADERVGVQVKLWNPLRTCAIPERFCSGDSLRRGAISSVCTFNTFTYHMWQNQSYLCQTVETPARRQSRGDTAEIRMLGIPQMISTWIQYSMSELSHHP